MDASKFVVTLFVAYISLITHCEGLYCTYRAQVTLNVGSGDSAIMETIVGDYADYGNHRIQLQHLKFLLIPDYDFGCSSQLNPNTTAAISKAVSTGNPFVLMIPLPLDVDSAISDTSCSDYKKATVAQSLSAAGVLFYYLPSSSSSSSLTEEDPSLSIPVAAIEISEDLLNSIQEQPEENSGLVAILGYCYPSIQSSQTFYFVVFTFCILTVLSCLWFMLSYIRRCRLRAAMRRRRVSACVCVCVCACVRACVRVCVCVCVWRVLLLAATCVHLADTLMSCYHSQYRCLLVITSACTCTFGY